MTRATPAAFVFDAYGTLYDVQSVVARAEMLAPGRGAALGQLWRAKQLEYSWLSSLMISPAFAREDFSAITGRALDYAVEALGVGLSSDARERLLAAYLDLAPYPDARVVLERLAPRPRVILSNGTRSMLAALLDQSGLDDVIDSVLSVDAAGIYKPHPSVYRLAVDHLGVEPAAIVFVSANGWDAAGAKAFGFTTCWINRAKLPIERHAPAPDHVVDSLSGLLAQFA
jgi:2-haloacid dehalogenase